MIVINKTFANLKCTCPFPKYPVPMVSILNKTNLFHHIFSPKSQYSLHCYCFTLHYISVATITLWYNNKHVKNVFIILNIEINNQIYNWCVAKFLCGRGNYCSLRFIRHTWIINISAQGISLFNIVDLIYQTDHILK